MSVEHSEGGCGPKASCNYYNESYGNSTTKSVQNLAIRLVNEMPHWEENRPRGWTECTDGRSIVARWMDGDATGVIALVDAVKAMNKAFHLPKILDAFATEAWEAIGSQLTADEKIAALLMTLEARKHH